MSCDLHNGILIKVKGIVQGVGFRPFIWHLAQELGVRGQVGNDGQGVYIKAMAPDAVLQVFLRRIQDCPLPLARVQSIDYETKQFDDFSDEFNITPSVVGVINTGVAIDAASCRECLKDVSSPSNRRFAYPFTNCTHCGPRFTIIKSIPYDRCNTSMSKFPMCSLCLAEYNDPSNRRFHAQPNACSKCGPSLWLYGNGTAEQAGIGQQDNPIDATVSLIKQGKIIAVKGLGGFQLVCDATSDDAVRLLRQRKNRYAKPFALMARDLQVVANYCHLNQEEADLLQSPSAPIMILKKRENGQVLATDLAPSQNTFGFMLPYTPLHFLLLKDFDTPIICTSGNLSEEPQSVSNEHVVASLGKIADQFLMHDRDVVNRLDDSVVRCMKGGPRILRRARGYAPAPISLPAEFRSDHQIIAMGAELKNTFCFIADGKATLSQHIGDLGEANTFADYKHNIALYEELFCHQPKHVAIDMHVDYLSTKFGMQFALSRDAEVHMIQHHHAHIASCMVDNNWSSHDGPVLGIAMDGLGMGLDSELWGAEFILSTYREFKRLASIKPAPLIGGSQAMRQPWRNTLAQIKQAMDWTYFQKNYGDLEIAQFLSSMPLATYDSMLASNTNVPLASSCGRLFDAVAAALGICREQATYEGQAAIELEVLASSFFDSGDNISYSFQLESDELVGLRRINPAPMWHDLLADLKNDTSIGLIAWRFHKGLAEKIVELTQQLIRQSGAKQTETVALSGGVFQNKIFLEEVCRLLEESKLNVLVPAMVPANDGGISLGQAVITAANLI